MGDTSRESHQFGPLLKDLVTNLGILILCMDWFEGLGALGFP